MKVALLRFCYSKIDASTCHEKLENVKIKLYELFEEYASNTRATSTLLTQRVICLSKPERELNPRDQRSLVSSKCFKMFQNETISIARKSELDAYFDEAKLDYEVFEDLDVLNYRKDNAKRFSNLSIMARDVLSISITTVASESAFSIGGYVLVGSISF
ncbi:HAT [Theobroma cacao]|nr:HAT [Theobroma cacao]